LKNSRPLVIGSRGSALARWQSEWVLQKLSAIHPTLNIDIRVVKTTGDAVLDAPLSKIGDKGLFTKELDLSLLDGSIDLAVHSLKDVPTELDEGLTISAITEREDARDVFIGHPDRHYSGIADVPADGTIATSSLRRKFLLLQYRPGLTIEDVRGNLGTRIDKLKRSRWDGIILARAGIERLGQQALITETLPVLQFMPAVGQGALAILSRPDDEWLSSLVRALDHGPTRQATLCERSLLRRLEGGCQVPVGAYGRIENGALMLDAVVGSLDGQRTVRGSMTGEPERAAQLGIALAERLLADGGESILNEIRSSIRS
jgi:hydroxymethylbilane synthase